MTKESTDETNQDRQRASAPAGAEDDSHAVLTGAQAPGDQFTLRDINNAEVAVVGPAATVNIYRDRNPTGPPPIETIRAFLSICSLAKAKSQDSNYHVEFRVRVPGDPNNQGEDLFDTVQNILGHADECEDQLRRVVILGDSGSGKTSVLLQLQHKQGEASFLESMRSGHEKKDLILPIMISLAHLQTTQDLPALLRDSFNGVLDQYGRDDRNKKITEITTDQFNGLLQEYRCLLLFDGLEDAPQPHGTQRVRRFIQENSRHDYVLTCRTSAYRGQLGASVKTLFIDDLTEDEVKQVLDDKYERLNSVLRLLVRNRSLMQIVLNAGEELGQVHSKGRLLRLYYLQSLSTEARDRGDNALAADILELFLEELAFAMLEARSYTFSDYQIMQLSQKHIDEWHEPYSWREMADVLRNDIGVLARDDRRRWAFRDNTALAYFAAAAMLQQPSRIDAVLDNVQGIWWRETLSILIGLMPDSVELCYQLIERDVYVAATCIRTSGCEMDARVIDALIDVLIERLSLENTQYRRRIVMLLGESGHIRAIDALLRALQREWSSYVLVGILQAIAVWIKSYPSEKLGDYLGKNEFDKDTTGVIQKCVDELNPAMAREPNTSQFLSLIGDAGQTPRVRGLAAIGLGFCRNDDACSALIRLFSDPPDDTFVAWCVVEALTLYDNPNVFEAARQMYKKPGSRRGARNRDMRQAQAVYLLGWQKGEDRTIEILTEAITDDGPETRGFAAYALARQDFLTSRAKIEDRLRIETDPTVLRKIVEALAEIGDIDSIDKLERALRDNGAQTRWAIQRAIREISERHELQVTHDQKSYTTGGIFLGGH